MDKGEAYGVLGITPLLLKDFITTKYGKEKWGEVLSKAGLPDTFQIHTKYPPEAFGKLAGACCETLKLTVEELLEV
jgi:hypothetical protein